MNGSEHSCVLRIKMERGGTILTSKVFKEYKVCKVCQGRKVYPGQRVTQDLKGIRDRKVYPDHRVRKGLRGHRVRKGLRGHRVCKELRGHRVRKGLRGHRVYKVPLG